MASTKHGVIAPGVFMVQNTTDRDALGTDDNLVAGESLCVVLGEGIYRCDTAAAASSTWSSKTTGDATFEGDLTLNSASPTLTVGDGTGGATAIFDSRGAYGAIQLRKLSTNNFDILFRTGTSNTTNDKNILYNSDETLHFRHYNGAGWDDVMVIGNTSGGSLGFFGATPVGQSSAYTRNATVVEDRTLLASASATATNNNNVLAALIADLQNIGLLG